jgi:2-dehydro-3-deoxygluconokinase
MPAIDVVTFGETMIRLSPPNHQRLEAADSLDCRVGGSESNTAVALSRLGRQVSWWSKLPDNTLGQKVVSSVRRWGVETDQVIWSDSGRAGIYFIEFGSLPRAHQVHYDRAHSAISTLHHDEVDWPRVHLARHLHVTGITAALSESCAETVAHAVNDARTRGMSISMDVNYRAKLWSCEKARETLTPIIRNVDLLLSTIGDASNLFGVSGSPTEVARRLQSRLGPKTVVVTGSPSHVAAAHGESVLRADVIQSREVDRVGAGDAGDAGILHGYLDGDLELGLRYGCAMAALKQTMPGDELIAARSEIEALVRGVHSGIQR